MIEKSTNGILGCFVALAMWWLGCNDITATPTLEQIVVRGYLYTGEPVSDFQLTSSLPIGATDTTGPPIMDAGVTLQRNGISYRLIRDSMRPGYYVYPGNDLLVTSGDQFSLDVTRGDVHITAGTSVPARPQAVTISLDTLVVHVRTVFGNFRQVYSDDSLVVRWNGSENDLYYSTLKCVDANPQLILDDGLRIFNFISQPTSQSFYRVPVQNLLYVGRYMVRVYKVNQEYADLYRSRGQDSRSLNEPLTNVRNGLGVFSAFASDSVGLYVKLE